MTRFKLYYFIILLAVSFNLFAEYEEEDSYFELFGEIPTVFSSTRSEKNIHTAPSVMSVISKDMLDKRGYRYLEDALGDIINLNVNERFIGGQVINLRNSIEGNGGVMVLINGTAINDPLWKGFHGLLQMPLEGVRQIEVIRGPGGAIYGTGAMEGIINIVTEEPEQFINKVTVAAAVGDSDYKSGHISLLSGGDSYRFSLFLDEQIGDQYELGIEFDALQGTGIEETPATYSQDMCRKQIYSSFQYKGLEASIFYYDHQQDAFLVSSAFVADDPAESSSEHLTAEISHELSLTENLTITPGVYYTDVSFGGNGRISPRGFAYPYDLNNDGIIEFWPHGIYQKGFVDSELLGTELLIDFNTDNNDLKIGFFYEDFKSVSVDYTNAHPIYSFSLPAIMKFESPNSSIPDVSRNIKGGFFQNILKLNENYSFLIGGRYDDYSDFSAEFTPRTALVYHTERLTAKLLYGQAFRAPNLDEMNVNTVSYVANPDAEPYKTQTGEIFLSYAFSDHFNMQLNYFKTHATDVLVNIINSMGQETMQNYGDVKVSGVEVESSLALSDNLKFYLGYAYNDNDEVNEYSQRYLAAEHSYLLGIDFSFAEYFFCNLKYKVQPSYPREKHPLGDLDSYENLNLSFSFIRGNYSIKTYIYNLLDEENYISGYEGDTSDFLLSERKFSFRFAYDF